MIGKKQGAKTKAAVSIKIPPLSFVRRFLVKNRVSGRVDEATWQRIRAAWARTRPSKKKAFEAAPLQGLHLPRRDTAPKNQ